MLEADKSINEIISKIGGLYMRYSDDFIIICPSDSLKSPPKEFKNVIEIIKNIPRLTLEPDKTKCYYFEESKIVKLNDLNTCGIINDKNAQMINFLGFSFDGCKVYLRAKTISKYYYRMYKKAKTITKSHGYTYRGNHISNRNLYERYSQRGAHRPDKKGNFLTYIDRSINVYGKNEEINKSTKNHMQKIRKALKKKS
jgi:hypothetical protein